MHSTLLHGCLIILVVINLSLTLWRVGNKVWPLTRRDIKHAYTYIGKDYPLVHPSLTLQPASLTLQESVHYGANGSDPVTSREWETLKQYPQGGLGRVILGAEHREFLITFYHQLHCIRQIQRAVYDTSDKEATPHHMKHCMDYLRQTFLCSAVDTLEKGDFLKRDWEIHRTGGDLVCWDWDLVMEDIDKGWREFTDWRDHKSME